MRKKDDEKQQSIKNAVVRLILEKGFQGASIAKIAQIAGVSPATVYIYYENKEAMLNDIYEECTRDAVHSLLRCVRPGMCGEEIVARLIRQYYEYIVQNREVFYFIEQFDTCPALVSNCSAANGSVSLDHLLTELKQKRMVNNFDNQNLYAILFSPVKRLACHDCECGCDSEEQLEELIRIVQRALIP